MEQTAAEDEKALKAKWRRKMARLRRERARFDEIADLYNAKLDGIAEGRAQVIAESIAEGRAEGIAQGIAQVKAEIVLNMHKKGRPIADIVDVTDLLENEVRKIIGL